MDLQKLILTPNGRKLFELLSTAVCELDRAQEQQPRKNRIRASFSENQLRAHIRKTVISPSFRIELEAADDPCGRRIIDYACIDTTTSVQRPHLRAIAATCELKGPARPTIFSKPTGKNYYEQIKKGGELYGIKPDVSKQHQRSKRSPHTEHYVFWIIERPDHGEPIDSALARLLVRLRSDLDFVILTECARRNIDGLWMFLFRVS